MKSLVIKQARTVVSVLLALALGVVVLGLSACAASTPTPTTPANVGRTVEEIQKSGEITIAVFFDKAPFGSVDSAGEYAGYDIEYANRIGKDLGVKVKFLPVEPAARVETLESGKADIVLANFTVTAERAQKVDFVDPYMKVALGAVSPASAPVNTEADFAGKKIIVITGTTAETYFDKNLPAGATLVKFEQYTDAEAALSDGRGDVWLTDNTEAIAFANTNAGFVVPEGVASLGSADTIAGAVQKGNTSLLNWLNEEIVKLGTEKFFHAAYDKTLLSIYGAAYTDQLVVEGGKL